MADTIGIGERRTLSCNITNGGDSVDADVIWTCDTANVICAWPQGLPGQSVDPGLYALQGKNIVVQGAAVGGPVTLTAKMTNNGVATGTSATFQITVAAGVDVMSITSN